MALANPFGPPHRGREEVLRALCIQSYERRPGSQPRRARPVYSEELATTLTTEHWRARIGERDSVEPFDLRVTTTFRPRLMPPPRSRASFLTRHRCYDTPDSKSRAMTAFLDDRVALRRPKAGVRLGDPAGRARL